ncbi:10421_t:CDS:1 [Paraglomus occultum]|uniref:10421_t:CDS:1 n=1 Tax=Paraglomus occultum TaxID=144539 RepID=A0A9N8VM61_9GLOM|nr:10421_t:CDS:1 [Paraglomus occultum]
MAADTNANIDTSARSNVQSDSHTLPISPRFIGPHYLSVSPYYLSIPSPDDIQTLEYHLSDSNPDSESIHYWTLTIPRPYGIEDAEKFVNSCLDRTEKTGVCLQWAIRVQEEKTGNERNNGSIIWDSGNGLKTDAPAKSHFIPTLIGMIGVHLSENDPKRYEIGYWLSPAHRNRGVVSSAVAKACEIVFEGLGEEEIYGQTFVGNLSSRKVLEKNAFEYLGVVKDKSNGDIPIACPDPKSVRHTWLFRKRKE